MIYKMLSTCQKQVCDILERDSNGSIEGQHSAFYSLNNQLLSKYMRSSSTILGIIVLILGLLAISNGMKAQDIVRQGNTFVEQSDSTSQRGGKYTKTEYLYTDKKGVTDTVYVSSRGSAFVWKVSKKTGRTYRKYLPKVTEALGLKKDEDDENKQNH